MTLLEVSILINGRILGPLLTVAPEDARGDVVVPQPGDVVRIMVRPKGTGKALLSSAAKLQP